MFYVQVLGQFIPDSESDLACRWLNSIGSLERYAENFANDIRLFDYAEKRSFEEFQGKLTNEEMMRNISSWLFIACRDGAMQIFHFGKILNTLNTRLSKCPTLASHINSKELKLANSAFRSTFKDHEGVRHSVGHQGEVTLEPERNAGNTALMIDCLADRQYMTSYEGKVLSYYISEGTVAELEKAITRVKATLTPVLEHVRSLQLGQKLEPKK